MRKFVLLIILVSISNEHFSQTTSVEKSIFGIQTGFLGVWGHHETKLSRQFALRTEMGFDCSIYAGGSGYFLNPVITLEPRWYYNMDKRQKKSRRTDDNIGNYITIRTSYHPDLFIISNYRNVSVIPDIMLVPTWGIRRSLGKHFNYEAGAGVGYIYCFDKSVGFQENSGEVAINLHLRLGYVF